MIGQYIWTGITQGCHLSLLAIGFCLVYRTTSIFHLPLACVFAFTGYVCFGLLAQMEVSAGIGLPVSLFAGIALGSLIELGIYRPLARRGSGWNVLFVAAIGVYILLSNAFALVWGSSAKVASIGQREVWNLGLFTTSRVQVASVVACGCACYLLWLYLKHTRAGTAVRALGDNPVLSPVLGLDVNRTRTMVSVVASLFAGVAGVLYAMDVGVTPHSGMGPVLNAAIATMIAGRKSLLGTVLAAILLGLLQSMTVMVWSAKWQQVATFGVLAAVLLVRREGLMSLQTRAEER